MPVTPEVLLMILAVSIYLFDAGLLLYRNEAVLFPVRTGKYSVAFSPGWGQLFGRLVYLPNPFMPHKPVYRLSWQARAAPASPVTGKPVWEEASRSLATLAPFIWAMFLALFVLLPVGLFTRVGNAALFAGIAVLYLNAMAVLVLLFRRRHQWGMTGKRFAAIAFESLVCIPCALNLVRKISSAIPVREDLVEAGKRLLSPDDFRFMLGLVAAQVIEELDMEDAQSDRHRELEAYRTRITEAAR
jgi:hypothetical protein